MSTQITAPSIQSAEKRTIRSLPRVHWHEWTVVRLAGIAMFTVLAGYITAAFFAVGSIDQLLHLTHDDDVEWAIRAGMDETKASYAIRQDLIRDRLASAWEKNGGHASAIELETMITKSDTAKVLRIDHWAVRDGEREAQTSRWLDRSHLAVGTFVIEFIEGDIADTYRKSEAILQRYQVIGLELRERIRPALIRALSVTLAVMCALLLVAFVYMAVRSKQRTQQLIDGFVAYTDGDEGFRFRAKWRGELGLITNQFNGMADELATNRERSLVLEKLASWQTIARKMAHEIKNPLTPIQIMIAQLKRNYHGDDPKYKELVENSNRIILEEVATLRRMVDDFSEFARLPQATTTVGDFIATCKHAVALAGDTYAPHTVLFESAFEHKNVPHDDQLLRLVIHNLIKNAAESDPGKSSPITVKVRENATHAILEVIDNGPGVPEDLKERIFEAYVTTKHTGPSPGMGLGLAICQKVVLEHNGRLNLESKPGLTIFRITLPLRTKGQSTP